MHVRSLDQENTGRRPRSNKNSIITGIIKRKKNPVNQKSPTKKNNDTSEEMLFLAIPEIVWEPE